MDVVLVISMMMLMMMLMMMMMMLTVFLQLGYRPSARAAVEMHVNNCKWLRSAWQIAGAPVDVVPRDEKRKFQKGCRANTASL